ncbi:hypothetical protein Q3G72_026598 [Acer saccharum]|nr:hypothetical protein Q3G72_026598 [Acer saccharum]
MALKYNKATTFLVVSLAMIAALLEASTAQSSVHVVADALGWIVPPGGATVYSNWTANKTFKVNDVLVFNFTSGRHDVAQVTKAAFDACNIASPISKEINSPANITLTSAGEHYYICTFNGHCAGGQKLALNVTSDAATAPPSGTPPPSGNSAKSLGVALSSTFLAIFVALLC